MNSSTANIFDFAERTRPSSPVDTMTFQPVGSGTELTYTADFTLKGLSRFVAPLLKPAFERLGNQAETGVRAKH